MIAVIGGVIWKYTYKNIIFQDHLITAKMLNKCKEQSK